MKNSMLILSITVITLMTHSILPSPKVPAHFSSHPELVEFAWDIHQVLVDKVVSKMVFSGITKGGSSFLKAFGKLPYEYGHYLISGKKGKTLVLLDDIKKLMGERAVSDEFRPLIQEYDPKLWHAAQHVAVEHYPNKGIQRLIAELDFHGYTQRIASNIGSAEYSHLSRKHPALFSYFKGGKMVDYSPDGTTKKPDLMYFHHYQQEFNPYGKRVIIFIDDKLENVKAANSAGMYGILYLDAIQLRNDLKELGFPLS